MRIAAGVGTPALVLLLLSTSWLATAQSDTEAALGAATKYYEGIAGQRDFASVPLAQDVTFSGPGRAASSAEGLRKALRGLSPQVRSFKLRQQLADGEFVVTFYELDLGAPDGPIPMAEKLRVMDGKIVDIQLLFDSRCDVGWAVSLFSSSSLNAGETSLQ